MSFLLRNETWRMSMLFRKARDKKMHKQIKRFDQIKHCMKLKKNTI